MPINIGVRERIIKNRIRCKKCGDIIESHYCHGYKECSCGSCAVDGGHQYLRRCFAEKDGFEELSEVIMLSDEELEKERKLKSEAMKRSFLMQDNLSPIRPKKKN